MDKKLSVIVVSITPFDGQGQLDEPAFRFHLGRLRDAGVSVFVAGSGSGEGYALAPDESERVMTIAVEELKGRVPVRAMGCEPRLPSEMTAYLRRAERAGVDAAQIFSLDMGHGAKPSDTELERYYSTVIESVDLPVVLSSHHLMGYVLPLDLVEKLLDRYPSIIGINYGGSDIKYLGAMIERFSDRIEVHCGGPRNAVTTLALGGHGFMGGEGNFSPLLVASVISSFRERNLDELRVSFRKLLAFTTIYGRYGGSAQRAMKPLMNAFGLRAGTLRPPRLPISQQDLDLVVREVSSLELPGIASSAV